MDIPITAPEETNHLKELDRIPRMPKNIAMTNVNGTMASGSIFRVFAAMNGFIAINKEATVAVLSSKNSLVIKYINKQPMIKRIP